MSRAAGTAGGASGVGRRGALHRPAPAAALGRRAAARARGPPGWRWSTAPAASGRAPCCARSAGGRWRAGASCGRSTPAPSNRCRVTSNEPWPGRPSRTARSCSSTRSSGRRRSARCCASGSCPAWPRTRWSSWPGASRRAPDWFRDGWEHVCADVPLPPLPPDEARELLASWGVTDGAVVDRLVDWARGSPLALTLAVVTGGASARRPGRRRPQPHDRAPPGGRRAERHRRRRARGGGRGPGGRRPAAGGGAAGRPTRAAARSCGRAASPSSWAPA